MFKHKEQRRKQIDTLKVFNENVYEVAADEIYELKFQSGGSEITMEIRLEQEFPFKNPKLFVNPILSHPWIDYNEIKHFPGLLNFSANSDLGRVCQAIIREFEKNPPELASINQPKAPLLNFDQLGIAELNNLDRMQLVEIMQDDQYLNDFVDELCYMKSLNSELDTLIGEVETLSSENLGKESRLSELKMSVDSLSSKISRMGSKFNLVMENYLEKSQEFEPENILQLLEISVSNAESECDETIEKFLQGKGRTSEFLEDFMKVKKLKSLRKFKEERLNYQLRQMNL